MSTSHIFAGIIFGSIGFAAFIYGKKQTSFKALVIGLILMVYPYLVSNPVALWGIGVVLTLALFIIPG